MCIVREYNLMLLLSIVLLQMTSFSPTMTQPRSGPIYKSTPENHHSVVLDVYTKSVLQVFFLCKQTAIVPKLFKVDQFRMDSGRKMWIPLAISVIAYCFVGSSGTECAVNRCPHLEKCLQRHVPGQPDYVCECTEPYFNGYDCTKTSNNRILSTCYGADCATGSYTSPNYETTGYENRERILVLLYIPLATEIRFSFDPGFQIERNADELFVGQGLTIPHNDLGNGNNLNPALYLFDGFGAPAPFSVYNDTAFIFFVSDRSSTYAGFRIFWNATVADPPPMTPAPSTEGSTANTVVLHTGLLTMILASIVVAICAQK